MQQIAIFHGINAGPAQMAPLERHLKSLGHQALALGYSSKRPLVEAIAGGLRAVEERFPTGPVSLVGFSAGGLVARGVAAALAPERRKLLVQIAPPNRGATRAAWLMDRRLAKPFISRGFRDLRPGSLLLSLLAVPDCPIGILAGDVKFHPKVVVSWFTTAGSFVFGRGELAGPSDGSVGVEETQLPSGAATDWLLLPCAHDFFPLAEQMHRQVAHFLEHQRFQRPAR